MANRPSPGKCTYCLEFSNELTPNFGPLPGIIYDEYHMVLIPEEKLQSYANKLVRGMSLIIDGALLPCDYVIALYVVDEYKIGSVLKMFRNHGTLYHRGMGFILSRVCRNDNRAWLYAVQTWGRPPSPDPTSRPG